MAGKRLNIVVGEDVYVELVRRYGVRGLSRGVDQLLRAALFADNVVNAKTDNVVNVETSNVESGKAFNVVNAKTDNVESVKTDNVVNAKAASVQSPVERRELRVEVPPPKIELPGKPEPPPALPPAGDQTAKGLGGETAEERRAEGKAAETVGRGPTPKQLALIESLLKRLGDDWGTVREILLLDKGIEAPEDYRHLAGETLDRVIKALKEWARHPTAKELKDARVRAQKLFEQGIDVGLPESTRDVLRYHLVKLELAETGVLKTRK